VPNEEGRRQRAAAFYASGIGGAGRLELVAPPGDRLGAEEHSGGVPVALREVEDRAPVQIGLRPQDRQRVVGKNVVRQVSFARHAPGVAPLRAHLVPPQLGFEPSDIAWRILPGRQPSRARQSAEERNEIGTGADIDDIQLRARGQGPLHCRYRAMDNPVVVGMGFAVIVLEISLRVELSPFVVGIARRFWRR
jgi:hypothetical protein